MAPAPGFDTLIALGRAFLRAGQPGEASDAFRRALRLRPRSAEGHFLLGNACMAAARAADAVRAYRRALSLRLSYPEAANNLGHALLAAHKPGEAVACFTDLARLASGNADALASLAYAQQQDGDLAAASLGFAEAARLQPGRADFWRRAGEVAILLGDTAQAAAHRRKAAALLPQDAQMQFELGDALAQSDPQEALACFRSALALRPDHLGAALGLAYGLGGAGRFEDADAVLRAFPESPATRGEILTARGDALRNLMRLEEAATVLEQAAALEDAPAGASMNLGMVRLLQGRYESGFALYEARLAGTVTLPRTATKLWRGEDLDGGTLLIRAEQGLGDTLQFCRFVKQAAARAGGEVVLMVQPPLVRLLQNLHRATRVVADSEPLPAHRAHVPLLSLPAVLGTSLADLGGACPYLHADPAGVAAWRQRLSAWRGLKIGLCWAGTPANTHDSMRSLDVADLSGLLGVTGVCFVSLQKRAAGAPPLGPAVLDWTGELADFADTACLVASLDLVVSVDTAVAHLAGALGQKVWLLNRFNTDWRWLVGRADSPWYPGHVVFRQAALGHWGDVLLEVERRLERLRY